jgi:REP element-mobilizing transposase RayT
LAVHADESIFLSAFRKAAQVEQRGNEYKIWESGYHPQLMDDHDKLLQKIEYIHLNPVRKGLVEKPEDWKYSSARNYLLNDESIIKIDGLF